MNAKPTTSAVDDASAAALLQRRGALCAAAQFAALEGIVDVTDTADARAELQAIDQALQALGIDPHSA